MARITRWISITERCAMIYRMQAFNEIQLPACQHMYIYYLCSHSDGISQDMLAKKVYVNKSNVARNIKSLEDAGYVYREVDSEDKRAFKVYPTSKAFDVLPFIKEKMSIFNEEIMKDFSESEKELLEKMLIKVAQNASSYINDNYEE